MKQWILMAGLLVTMGSAMADDMGDKMGGKGKHHGKMREAATAACAGKAENTAVTLPGRDGKPMTASCVKTPRGDMMAMTDDMRKNMQEHRQNRVKACEGKAAGDKATMSNPRHPEMTHESTCAMDGGQLLAHPDHKAEDRKAWAKKHKEHMKAKKQKMKPAA